MEASGARFLCRCQSPWAWRSSVAVRGAGAVCAAALVGNEYRNVSCHTHADHSHVNVPDKFRHDHGKGEQPHLLFAVPKKGRLYEQVTKLLAGAGIEYKQKDRLDIARCTSLPLSIVFLPAADIATYVGEGNIDLGITGEDIVAESDVQVDVLLQLGFGKCSLTVQAPHSPCPVDIRELAGRRIVTSFPTVARSFFKLYEEPGKPTQFKCISGSVEAACRLGLADGIVDIVETGTTMMAAGLEEVCTVMTSQAVLIGNPYTQHKELVDVIRKRIAGYLTAQSWVMVMYNVHRSNLSKTQEITPGKRSPTVTALEEENWVSVSALVPLQNAAIVMDELVQHGAKDVLLTSLLSTRMGDC